MTDDEVFRIMHAHFEGLFPKVCPTCGRRFATLKEYILTTRRMGDTISYDAEMRDWEPKEPLGSVALANCPCGTTLALTTKGLPLEKSHGVLRWIKTETEQRGVSPRELTALVRDEVRRRALRDEG